MIVLVDEEKHAAPVRRFRPAPPVASDVRSRKEMVRSALSNRTDGYEDSDVDLLSLGTASLVSGQAHLPGAARHIAVDGMRMSSQRDERGLRSGSSSIQGYMNGREGSVDSFHI